MNSLLLNSRRCRRRGRCGFRWWWDTCCLWTAPAASPRSPSAWRTRRRSKRPLHGRTGCRETRCFDVNWKCLPALLTCVPHSGRLPLLTQPHVLHVDDEAAGQVEDGEECVAHEGRGLQGGQSCGHAQRHGPAAVHHQPHQQQVEQEALRHLVQARQPVDGQPVDQGEDAVLRKLPEDLQEWAGVYARLVLEVVMASRLLYLVLDSDSTVITVKKM